MLEQENLIGNSTNNNNRMYASMRTRPISKSIDSFRHTNTNGMLQIKIFSLILYNFIFFSYIGKNKY